MSAEDLFIIGVVVIICSVVVALASARYLRWIREHEPEPSPELQRWMDSEGGSAYPIVWVALFAATPSHFTFGRAMGAARRVSEEFYAERVTPRNSWRMVERYHELLREPEDG